MDKIKTSIQYQYTNNKFFMNVFKDSKDFFEKLREGPENLKEYIFKDWIKFGEELKNDKRFELNDFYREFKKDEFDISFNKTTNGTSVFFFKFPNYEYTDAASICVAVALTEKMPRYFTLECSKHVVSGERCWTVGEFRINEKNRSKSHINYTTVDNNRISWFAGFVLGLLEKNDFKNN